LGNATINGRKSLVEEVVECSNVVFSLFSIVSQSGAGFDEVHRHLPAELAAGDLAHPRGGGVDVGEHGLHHGPNHGPPVHVRQRPHGGHQRVQVPRVLILLDQVVLCRGGGDEAEQDDEGCGALQGEHVGAVV